MQSNYNNFDQNTNSMDTNNTESINTTSSSSGIKFLQNQKFQSKKARLIAGGLFVLFLVVALVAGYFLTQTGQDLRQRAASGDYPGTCYSGSCPAGWEPANTGMCYPQCNGTQICCIPSTSCSDIDAGTPQCPVHSNLATACPNWAMKNICTRWLNGECHPVYGLVCPGGSWGVPCTPGEPGCQHCSVCGNDERCPVVTPTPPTYNSPTPTPPTYNSPTPTPTGALTPTPTATPTPTGVLTPTPTPVQVYPQCLSVVMTEPDQTPILDPELADIGQLVRFRCLADDPALVSWYEFRVARRVPVNQSMIIDLASEPVGSNFSSTYEIMAGEYIAQCRICSTNAQPGVCDTEWEPIIWPESETPIPTHTPLPPPGSMLPAPTGIQAYTWFDGYGSSCVEGNTYYYKVYAYNNQDVAGVGSATQNIIVPAGDDTIHVSWNTVTDAEYYRVFMSQDSQMETNVYYKNVPAASLGVDITCSGLSGQLPY